LRKPLDAIEEQLTLLVVHQLVAVTVLGFPKDWPLYLVADGVAEYTSLGHEATPSWSRPRGAGTPPGPLLYLTPISYYERLQISTNMV